MGLKSIVSALLPEEYREQVLGDLHERSFHLGDIASVLPQVWWSHLRRSAGGSILAGASEAALRHRAQQFQFRRLLGACITLALFTQATWEVQMFWMAVPIGLYVLTFLHFSDRTSRPGRDAWVAIHRKQLTHSIQSSRWGGYPATFAVCTILYRVILGWRQDFQQQILQILGAIVALPVFFILARVHAGRLRKELETLQ